MTYRIASDIGGTFTDVYVQDGDGEGRSFKAPTTREALTDGLFDALETAATAYDRSLSGLLGDTERFIHGSTVATNAIIEDDAAPTALITTEGFRDILWLREQGKPDPYEWHLDYPDPYVPRSRTYTVPERIDAEGEVVVPLDEDAVRDVLREIVAGDAETVAVCLLWSHVTPDHERRIGELIEAVAPDLAYSLSHEVNPVIREHRRASSTTIDASLSGVVSTYLERLETRLQESGFSEAPLFVTANGGVMSPSEVAQVPIWTVDSGPTMVPVAAAEITREELDSDSVIALDMGGTSLDLSVVVDGTVPRTREATVGADHLLGVEKVDVTTIGAGGGSIARVDAGGLIHVGPDSAGADPGPACYLRGGTAPTVTDAALVLGYLDEDNFLGGSMAVSRSAAEDAVADGVADGLGLDVVEAAHAVYATAAQNVVNGVRELTLERGIDPRNHVLFGGGGALGLFAGRTATELRIDDVLLPGEAGVVSSVGGLASDVRRDFSASNYTEGSRFDHGGVNDVLESVEADARAFLDRLGVAPADRELRYFTEARYPQQVYELEVELPGTRVEDGDETALMERFHRVHDETYGFHTDEDVEFLYWRVEATGKTHVDIVQPADGPREPTADLEPDTREAYFDGMRPCLAYGADDIGPGHTIEGPAFVDAATTTVVVPPERTLVVTDAGNYHLRLSE